MRFSSLHFLCVAGLLVVVSSASAEGPEQTQRAIGVGAPEGWLPVLGAWDTRGGLLKVLKCQEGGGHYRSRAAVSGSLPIGAVALFGRSRWQDYEVEATVVSGTDVPNILLRARDPANCIQFGRYGSRVVLYRFKDGTPTTVKEIPRPLKLPETLRAGITGLDFRGYCDGELIIEHGFAADEIPDRGKAGLQANHPGAAFGNLRVTVARVLPDTAPSGAVDVGEISISAPYCGLQRITAVCGNPAGLDAISGVYFNVSVFHEGQWIPAPTIPPMLAGKISESQGAWVGDLFTLHEGEHRISVHAYDLDDTRYEKTITLSLQAREGSYTTCGDAKLFEFVDPHPVWRGLVDHSVPSPDAEESFSNYLWNITWTGKGLRCQALTLAPQPDSDPSSRYRIVPDKLPLLIYPRLRDAAGDVLSGPVTRRLGEVTSMFFIQPEYEMATPVGKLVWGADIGVGDPIVRFHGEFRASEDAAIECEYVIEHAAAPVAVSTPKEESANKPASRGSPLVAMDAMKATAGADLSDNFILCHVSDPAGSPLFAYAFNRRPARITPREGGGCIISSEPLRVAKGSTVVLPSFSLIVVDSYIRGAVPEESINTAKRLAHAAMATPSPRAAYRDAGLVGDDTCRVKLRRDYAFQENDWRLSDSGQLIAVPWCAGKNTAPKPNLSLHTAFGLRPFLITKKKEIRLNLPLPELDPDKVTPDYEPLAGDWLDKTAECIEYIYSQQNPDGTFRGYDRMDHYSLARMTLGLMVAYRGLAERPETQRKIEDMVRRALARMMGEEHAVMKDAMQLEKGFSTGVDKLTWQTGDVYEPFAYHPKWGVHTEMGSLVDQNLGHAHLLFTLLLYGRYIDPEYLRRPDIQGKIQELIRFQWLSQDWNGDIWRVYVGGADAAGGGDGFEEDLALTLPLLAKMAGLNRDWVDLSYRVAAMKFGALRQFDYLPLDNEWGFEFLTPMHHPTEWVPEGGWGLKYRGDIWWTGPSVCSGYYGPWYIDSVYKPIPEVFRRQWYELLEDCKDVVPVDGRHWLTVGGYCSEARLFDPFLGAVKLMRAYRIAKEKDFLMPATQGEYIWNFCFYPAAMTVINHEILRSQKTMKDCMPVEGGAESPDPDHLPAYCWKTRDGAVVSVAGYRIPSPQSVNIRLNPERLGLSGESYRVTDIRTGRRVQFEESGSLTVQIEPRKATTLFIGK